MKRWVLTVALLGLPLLITFSLLHFLLVLGLPLTLAGMLAAVGLLPIFAAGYVAPERHATVLWIAVAAISLPFLLTGAVLLLGQRPLVAWWLIQPSLYLTLAVLSILMIVLGAGTALKRFSKKRRAVRWAVRGVLVLLAVVVFFFGVHLRQVGLLPFARGGYINAYE